MTQETTDRPAAPGVGVRLEEGPPGPNQGHVIVRTSDDTGTADFGVIQPGDWGFALDLVMNDGQRWTARVSLNVLPGTRIAKSSVCPALAGRPIPVSVKVACPPDLADKGLAVVAMTLRLPDLLVNQIRDRLKAEPKR